MADKSVNELAQQVGRPVEKLLAQLVEAGLPARVATGLVTDSEQEKLVAHLRQSHGQAAQDKQITLQRKTLGNAKAASSTGKAKTINVEVRKKHTFVKPDPAVQNTEREKLELEARARIQASIQASAQVKTQAGNFDDEKARAKTEAIHQANLYAMRRDAEIKLALEKRNKIQETLRILDLNLLNDKKSRTHLTYKLNSNMDLIELDLHGMQLTDLSELDKYDLDLTHLVSLDLSANSFSKLIITNPMPELKSLDLDGNDIQYLGLIDTKLTSWEVVKNLNLNVIRELYLNGNSLPILAITAPMPNLEILEIFDNRIPLSKVEISVEMKALHHVSMRNSQIEEFVILKREDLPCLSYLDLRNNNIRKIGIPLAFFDPHTANERDILLDNNRFSDLILAALKKDSNEARYQEILDILKDTTIVNRVKLIFIGNTGVGKSTLYKILKEGGDGYITQTGDSTHGVNIFNYQVKSSIGKGTIDVNGYDFGGQDYYHSTHYSFFGSNALYILLWGAGHFIYHRAHCIRNDKEEISYPLNYWLDSVEYFSKKEQDFEAAQNSDVLEEDLKSHIEKIDQNKLNDVQRPTAKNNGLRLHLFQNPKKILNCEPEQPYELDIVTLRQKFNFIDKVIDIASLINTDFSDYREPIKKIIDDLIDDYARPEDYPKILNEVEKKLINNNINNSGIIIPIKKIKKYFEQSKKVLEWEGDFEQILEWLDITMSIYWVSQKTLKVKEDLTLEENKYLEDYESNILNNSFRKKVSQDENSFPKRMFNKISYVSPSGLYSNKFPTIDPITTFDGALIVVSEEQKQKAEVFEIKNKKNKEKTDKAVKKLKILLREDLNARDKELLSEHAVLKLADLTDFIHNILDLQCTDHIDSFGIKKGYFTHNSITAGYEKNWDTFKNSHQFSKTDAIHFLEKYLDYIIAFMLYNKIAFRAPNPSPDGNTLYIAPTYLDESLSSAEEIFLSAFDKPIVEYRFDGFYHVNIFTEVLVKFQKHLSNSQLVQKNDVDYLLWKNKAILFENRKELLDSEDQIGVSLSSESKQALLYLDFDLGEILDKSSDIALDDQEGSKHQPCIRLRTFGHNKKGISESFLRQIMNFIDEQLEGYTYEKFAIAPNKLDYVSVNAMENCLDNHEGIKTGLFSYDHRLYRLSDFNLFTKNRSPMKKIFISYSTNDYQELQDFTTHIHPLKRQGLIDHWHCSQLIAGNYWDASIQQHLYDSDIICLLISPSWLANDYVFNNEVKTAIERKENFKMNRQGRDIIIMPIIIKTCIWDKIDWLKKIQAAPQKGKALSTFADKDEGWNNVARKLIDILSQIDDPTYEPDCGGRLGDLFVKQYEGKLDR